MIDKKKKIDFLEKTLRIFNRWNDVTGYFQKSTGYYFEMEGILEDIDKLHQKLLSTQKQQILDILEHNKDDMTGLYDYDGIAQAVIDLVKK